MTVNMIRPTSWQASAPASADQCNKSIKPKGDASGYLALGTVVIVMLLVGMGVWSTTEISGAIVASGVVVVDSNVKKIQHPTGGVVGQILVKDGDTVQSGDLLLRLDDTVTRANVQVLAKQLDEIAVRQARLRAELDESEDISFPAALQIRFSDPQVSEITTSEVALFRSRRNARNGHRSQLRERISQLHLEVTGLEAQQTAKVRELAFANEELSGLETLDAKRLVSTTKITVARRGVAQLEGDLAQVIASVAQARGKIAEVELQITQLDQDLKSEAGKDLRDQQAKEAELRERMIAAEDILKRVDIRAPKSGRVHQLSVHTVGGVVTPGELLMTIVPDADQLVIEANVPSQDIDQVQIGHGAEVRFTAFNQRTTPTFQGLVARISADIISEDTSRQKRVATQLGSANYYSVRIEVDEGDLKGRGKLRLVPGMPAEVMIKTDERTILSYLAKPVTDQFTRAFRER